MSHCLYRLKNLPAFLPTFFAILFFLITTNHIASAQAGGASISGRVTDKTGAILRNAEVDITNRDTNVKSVTTTNAAGIYNFPSLPPANYVLSIHKQGFRSVDLPGITIYTQDVLERNITLEVGSVSESVTVTPTTTNESSAVSLTVSREFVEDMPLNGQSFQDLIQLTPGAVSNEKGDYSVDGQRTDANIYTVDGVSANLGGEYTLGLNSGFSGSAPMTTVLGTTQSLASLDSLQEFKIQTSGYAAEYGRSPGAQIQFTSRSGSNTLHGSLSEFLRNTIFDANSDANDYYGTPKSAEHQNDFGGTLGGPIVIPRLYDGRDKSFFFVAYEGLRLLTPSSETEYVPTQALRNAASTTVRPFLNSSPLPNPKSPGNDDGCTVTDPSSQVTSACDAMFYYGYSSPNQIDNLNLRVDKTLASRIHAFLRYSDTPSSQTTGAETSGTYGVNTHTWTVGLAVPITPTFLDDFRFNYTRDGQEQVVSQVPVGGSIPFDRNLLIPPQYDGPFSGGSALVYLPGTSLRIDPKYYGGNSNQGQYQFIDSLSWNRGKHGIKFGFDWRRIKTSFQSQPYSLLAEFESLPAIQAGYATSVQTSANTPTEPVLHNISIYAQDHWNATSKLSLDIGLRWEFNPPPSPVNGEYPAVLTSDNIITAAVAPLGTSPYQSQYSKFAPRVGFAWQAMPIANHAVTVRGGFGIFYDTGQQVVVNSYELDYPFEAYRNESGNIYLPFSSSVLSPPETPVGTGQLAQPYGYLQDVVSHGLTMPYTEQWNLSLDGSLNPKNTLTLSYVGNNGRKLLLNEYFSNQTFSNGIQFTNNAAKSSYNALQLQDVGQIFPGLDVVASFAYSHSLDNASTDANGYTPLSGNSDYDLRRVLNVALNYATPRASWKGWVAAATHGWLVANRFTAQSGYPLNVVQGYALEPNGAYLAASPDLVSGVKIYLHGQEADANGMHVPGNWRLNRSAFSCTTTGATSGACSGSPTRQGTLGRNFLRTPSFWTLNTSLQRTFPIRERLGLKFRADAFNIFNHPNLNSVNASLSNSVFGQLVGGGVAEIGAYNSLYAMGAPRSLQLGLKLEF